MTQALRLTWVQPEDLIGHELRQAEEDGRDGAPVRDRWLAAGGALAPERGGASPVPAPGALRALAEELLGELAALPCPSAADEPTSLTGITAACHPAPAAHGDDSAGGERVRTSPVAPAGGTGVTTVEPYGPHQWSEPHESYRPSEPYESSDSAGSAPRTTRAPGPADTPRPRPARELEDALHAAWLGRAAGCLLGKPVEKLPLQAIRDLARATGNWPLTTWFTAKGLPPELAAAHPWNRRSAPTSLAENIDGMPEDDDLNYPLLGLLLLQRHGRDFTTHDVARLWLDELPAGRTFTAERVAYRNLLCGIELPLTASHRNPFREWIGAAIRADVHGWTNPGEPAAAAAQAYRDAALTHTANGVYGAMFTAAAVAAAAAGTADVHAAIAAGLTVVPPRSRFAAAVRFGVRAAGEHADFTDAVDSVHAEYGAYHWVHVLPNAALLVAALTHADGDFTGSICRAVSGGLDTDSNGATAGSLAGLLAGRPDALPDRWTTPLKNRLATSVTGFDGVGFDTLAHLTLKEALRP
ncbi:ADP-ribosylglycohydrolase family protein [Streptomyces pristinaespiralis]|uniref:ADP-ribosylglycohydrolase family protein n=1 Tax=Streptomyces pristinaespiralis TaxID=38300 RepID=UPI0037915987